MACVILKIEQCIKTFGGSNVPIFIHIAPTAYIFVGAIVLPGCLESNNLVRSMTFFFRDVLKKRKFLSKNNSTREGY